MTFENLVCLADVSLVYRVIPNLAAPPLKKFISLRPDNKRTTRTTSRGYCVVQHRRTNFGRSAFSVRATNYWNSVPNESRDISPFTGFKYKIKSWLKSTQLAHYFVIFLVLYLNIVLLCLNIVILFLLCFVVLCVKSVKPCYCCLKGCLCDELFFFVCVFFVCLFFVCACLC